jgi:hypothetical protein
MEQEDIIKTVSAVFNGADEHNWQKVHNAMADEVLLDYASLSGSPAATLTSKQIVEAWKGFLPGFDKTHHQLSNFAVTQNGNTLTVHFTGKADHFIDKDIWTVEATYDADLSKTNDKWRVTMLKLNLTNQSGNTNLPALAAQRLAK